MTTPSLDADPACPPAVEAPFPSAPTAPPRTNVLDREPVAAPGRLVAVRRPFGTIDRATWDRLADANPWATPFSRWAVHRAWWDAYGATAHDETTVLLEADERGLPPAADAAIVAIAPLMHRHEVEPGDEETATRLRHGHDVPLTPVAPTAKAVFFGASYHADYATLLCAPGDLPAVAEALVAELAEPLHGDPEHPLPWDVVDLRRLRCGDPAADALAAAFGRREQACDWTLNIDREDVCPVVTLPVGATFDDYLATLGKKERHEIRRKLRRAAAYGEVRLDEVADPLAALDTFIELHQKRWGTEGLFPEGPGGDASRLFLRRLFELSGPDGEARLTLLRVGEQTIASGIHFDDGERLYFYNAGIDPDARELSPGVLMSARYVERALELGRRSLDYLRGDETYKYEWGAVDEPIQRLLVRRTVG